MRHTFTHFHLVLRVLRGTVTQANKNLGDWVRPEEFGTLALPTVMKKVFALARAHSAFERVR